MLHIYADAQRKLPTWHFGGTNRPNDFASIWVYVYSVRIDFGLRIKGYSEAPEAIAQDMVSGNANLGIVLDMELQSLGYLCVAEQPLGGVIVLVGIRYAMGGEADACGVGNGIVAHGRGIALLGVMLTSGWVSLRISSLLQLARMNDNMMAASAANVPDKGEAVRKLN